MKTHISANSNPKDASVNQQRPQESMVECRRPETLEFHPVADAFPVIADGEFRKLVESIRECGQLEPIWLDAEGRIIDGGHRVKACCDLGIDVKVRQYEGPEESILGFVVGLNLRRRQLKGSQLAMLAARLAGLEQGERQDRRICPSTTIAEAAKQVGVSPRSVKSANKVLHDGVEQLVKAVDAGKVTVSAAGEVAGLKKQEQREALLKGPTEIRRLAKKSRENRSERRAKAGSTASGVPQVADHCVDHEDNGSEALPPEAERAGSGAESGATPQGDLDTVGRLRLEHFKDLLGEETEALRRALGAWLCRENGCFHASGDVQSAGARKRGDATAEHSRCEVEGDAGDGCAGKVAAEACGALTPEGAIRRRRPLPPTGSATQ